MNAKFFDCFTFFKELDLLDIRLHELAPVVDHFVIVEAARTFSGEPKPLIFAENRNRFAAFDDKIIHVVVDEFPPARSAWDRESYQRRQIARGIASAGPEDYIIISDVDEIPRRSALQEIIASGKAAGAFTIFGLDEYHHRLNLHREGFTLWLGTRMMQKKLLRDIQAARKLKAIPSKSAPWLNPLARAVQSAGVFGRPVPFNLIEKGGWHFTSIGSAAEVADKIRSYSHQEYNLPDFIAESRIDDLIASRRGLLVPDIQLRIADAKRELPGYVADNPALFAHIMA